MPISMPSVAPSASTKSMSSDRGDLGKILGHLYIAGKILLEGHVSTMDEVRHEIRTVIQSGGPELNSGSEEESSGARSLETWIRRVTRMLLATRKLPDPDCLPDALKKELAGQIQQGKRFCSAGSSASDAARGQIRKAAQLYKGLSGVCYL